MNYPQFENLVKIIEKLRDPKDGCPWDLKQTHKSLLKYLIEESYEFIHATEENQTTKMEDELGDVLLQVLLHSTIGKEAKTFDIETISKTLSEKLIRRHPHIFSKKDSSIKVDQVLQNWKEIKKSEKKENNEDVLFDNSFLKFPALFSANKIGERTNHIGFDWNDFSEVRKVVEGEWQEFIDEIEADTPSKDRTYEEFGDLLFSMAQLGRHLKIDPEQALRDANKKFLNRFSKMEELIKIDKLDMKDMNQLEMDKYWDKVKALEK